MSEMFDGGSVARYRRIMLMRGYTDLRMGIPSLVARLVAFHDVNPVEEDVLYMFCGRSARRVKGVVRQRGCFVLATVLMDRDVAVRWPRDGEGLVEVTPEELSRILGRPPGPAR